MFHLRNLFASVLLIGSVASCSSSSEDVADTADVAPDTMKDVVVADTADVAPDTMKDMVVADTTKVVDKKMSEEEEEEEEVPGGPSVPVLTLAFTATKTFSFSWAEVPDATSYELKEAPTVGSGYTRIFETSAATAASFDHTATSFDHVVPLYRRLNAKYMLKVCNAIGCAVSAEVLTGTTERVAAMVDSIGYFKASNTGGSDVFGFSVSLSPDGSTLAVGAPQEDSNSQDIDGDEDDDSAENAGAVYVFTLSNTRWTQQAQQF